ncbi:ATP-binding protein [Oceanithermus sp.]
MNPWQEAWEDSELGLVLLEGGRVVYVNPAAARLLNVEPRLVTGRPAAFTFRDHRLLELLQNGGEKTVEVLGRSLRVVARGEKVFLTDVTDISAAKRRLEEERRILTHEFRTPVAGLAGLIELLKQDLPADERKKALDLMSQEAARLLRLVEGQGRQTSAPWSPLELRERLERLLPAAAGVEWRVSGKTVAGRDQVFQVLLNLVDNALRYGRPPVLVRDRREEGCLLLEVVDAGPELPDYEALFEPGSRGVHAAGVRGSGLGLALVRRIARSWGGAAYGLRLEEGNAFGVSLPEEDV